MDLTPEQEEKMRIHFLPHDFSREIKLGDIVSIQKGSYAHKTWWKTFVGKVTHCSKWEKYGPLTTENHGAIDVEIIEIKSSPKRTEYLNVGDTENFCYWKWYEMFEVIS